VIAVRVESRKATYFRTLVENGELVRRGPAWMNFDANELSATVTTLPRREDAEQGINELMIVEYYSR
jgi:small subunit ribosomal protein S4